MGEKIQFIWKKKYLIIILVQTKSFKQNQILSLIEKQMHKLIVQKKPQLNLAWYHLPPALPRLYFEKQYLLTFSWQFSSAVCHSYDQLKE